MIVNVKLCNVSRDVLHTVLYGKHCTVTYRSIYGSTYSVRYMISIQVVSS